jgi:SAM-dependent methyltransferase
MSHFTSVDDSPDPQVLVASLDRSAGSLAAMKAYVTAALAGAVPGGRVLDLGCGSGHDLALLAGTGLRPIGIDPSRVMVAESADRVDRAPLVQADGARLPFADASFDGCRIERVLQHVIDPMIVAAEAGRVVRTGGVVAVFEPDWTSWRADTELPGAERIAAELHNVRHPDIGRRLPELVVGACFRVTDVVTEASVIHRIAEMPIGLEQGLARSVAEGRVEPELAARWLDEQHERDAAGTFRIRQSKILVLARRE